MSRAGPNWEELEKRMMIIYQIHLRDAELKTSVVLAESFQTY